MTPQQIEEQIAVLTVKHKALEEAIKAAEETHGNQTMIVDLGKKKLKLKEEIEKYKRML